MALLVGRAPGRIQVQGTCNWDSQGAPKVPVKPGYQNEGAGLGALWRWGLPGSRIVVRVTE